MWPGLEGVRAKRKRGRAREKTKYLDNEYLTPKWRISPSLHHTPSSSAPLLHARPEVDEWTSVPSKLEYKSWHWQLAGRQAAATALPILLRQHWHAAATTRTLLAMVIRRRDHAGYPLLMGI